MATTLLLATLTSPVAGAKTHDEIEKFYQSNENYSTPTVTENQLKTDTALSNQIYSNTRAETVLNRLEKQLANSDSIYETVSVLNQTNLMQQVVANQEEIYSDTFVSNVDSIRRTALEKVFGISLTDIDFWDNGGGKLSPTGNPYTTVQSLKDNATYATNANRQELIKYGYIEKNWQPYRWYYSMTNPSYFELVEGKLEYNKNYYANSADTYLYGLMSDYNAETDSAKKEELKKIYENELKATVNNYNKAPGYAVYSNMLHNILADNQDYTVTPASEDYFKSKWYDTKVRSGESIDGTNPYKDIIKGLQNGTLVGSIAEGYKHSSKVEEPIINTTTETKIDKNLNKEINKALDKATVSLKTEPNAIANIEENKIMDVKPVKKETEKQPSLFDRIILKVKQVANLD